MSIYNELIKYYQKAVYPSCSKIVCIGDIHGDYTAFIKALKKGKIIDNNLNYIAGNTHIVQMGDILDRKSRDDSNNDEDSELKILSIIIRLQKEAYINNGGFHCIIGNHELMNIQGDFSYVSNKGFKSFNDSIIDRLTYFKPNGIFAKYLSDTWNPVIIIGTNLFAHGGISIDIASKYNINIINELMRNYLRGNIDLINTSAFNKLFLDDNGILWNREYYLNNNSKSDLITTLKSFKCNRMIVGHTPQINGIVSKFNKKIWFVDTGMSEAFGKKNNKSERIHVLTILYDGNSIISK